MSTSKPLTPKDARAAAPGMGGSPVPAPPKQPLVAPNAVHQTSTSRGREHEVQRLIRDLAVLAATRRPKAS
ncbi:hypothetical protein QFZ60_002141 [Arthrobacter sp. B2I5]|jgi:hypothetical protein|uniref:hypothetical protein n=1 Tax=Arthrobacter sp. B2I5 TaxID=3042266 RepID=UPI002788F459|nr:hypothetical protein [Arthrobacter sp. B2I5]MDQ0825968.1 hypothetical protein [Arthrobacter sp. B2I5]